MTSSNKTNRNRNGHAKSLPVIFLRMNEPVDREKAYKVRVGQVLTLFEISHSTLYERIKRGALPKPDGKDTRPFWWKETLVALMPGVQNLGPLTKITKPVKTI